MSGDAALSGIFVASRDNRGLAAIQPRIRLAVAIALLLVLALLRDPVPLLLALAGGVAMVLAAGLSVSAVLRRLAVAEGFLVALVITLPFTVPGEPLLSPSFLTASVEGTTLSLTLLLRINAAALVILALLGRMGGLGLAAAMRGLGLPASLCTLMQLTTRYIATLGDEYRRLTTAMRVRGFRPRSTVHTWRSLGSLAGMVLVRSLERADRVHKAMLCRGYSGHFPAPEAQPLRRADLVFLALGLAFCALLLVLEFAP